MRTAPALTARASRPKAALRWLPTFLGFPLGGLAAELVVGPVDGLGPAVAGGAITGAVLGLAQWLGLHRARLSLELWVIATVAGLAAGLGAGAAAVGYRTSMGALALQGAISGAAVGLAQAALLFRRLGPVAWAWPVVVSGAWALGWTITVAAGIDVETQYTVFGSSGALAVTAITSVLAIVRWPSDDGGITTIDHIALACRDPQRSLRFYRDVLGVEGDVREADDGFVITTPSRVHFTLLRGEPPAFMGDFHVGVSLADADAVRAARTKLAGLGLVEHEWCDEADYVSVKVLDPDGYVVEVSWDAP